MAQIDFMRADVLATISKLRALADDLEKMTIFQPGSVELSNAPMLEEWGVRLRPVPAIVGTVQAHPYLDNGPIVTSEVYALDHAAGWARTFSRFYRLGPT